MKNLFILSLLAFSFCLHAQDIPLSWIGKKTLLKEDSQVYAPEKIESIIKAYEGIIDKANRKYDNLERIDASIGISGQGGIGIFSTGFSKSVEFIWRKETDTPKTMKTLSVTQDEQQKLKLDLVEQLKSQVDWNSIKPSVRRKILKTLHKDAKKISTFAKTMSSITPPNGWQINSFWRNYYFSFDLGILDFLKVGYDKRIRFRFKITPSKEKESSRQSELVDKLFKKISKVDENEIKRETGYNLYRLRASFDLNISGDIKFASLSAGSGFLVEYTKTRKADILKKLNMSSLTIPFLSILKTADRAEQNRGLFKLNEVRFGLSVGTEFDIFLASLELESSFELHFRKGIKTSRAIDFTSPWDLALKQIDHRDRLSLTFQVPFLASLRVRPSVENRYEPSEK